MVKDDEFYFYTRDKHETTPYIIQWILCTHARETQFSIFLSKFLNAVGIHVIECWKDKINQYSKLCFSGTQSTGQLLKQEKNTHPYIKSRGIDIIWRKHIPLIHTDKYRSINHVTMKVWICGDKGAALKWSIYIYSRIFSLKVNISKVGVVMDFWF